MNSGNPEKNPVEKRKKISFGEIFGKVKAAEISPASIDLVVGIGKGGIIPAALFAHALKKELAILWIQYYEPGKKPEKRFVAPKLMKQAEFGFTGKKVLLVDDFSRSGDTMNFAENVLLSGGAKKVEKAAVAGKKPHCLIECAECVEFPWD